MDHTNKHELAGRCGHIQGLLEVTGALLCVIWQVSQSPTNCSIAESNAGHQTWSLARAFILTIAGWFRCNSANTVSWCFAEITTLVPLKRHPTVLHCKLTSFSKVAFQIVWNLGLVRSSTKCKMNDSRQQRISGFIFPKMFSIDWHSGHLNPVDVFGFHVKEVHGSLDNALAFAFCLDLRYLISYW